MQLSARVKLEKPASEDEDATDLINHFNSKMETVYLGERLTEDAFFKMLDQKLSSLFSFTSHGSGWMLKDINGLYVKLVSYVPVRGSSYLALPRDLQSMNCLLNIRNPEDNNCFLFCYVAAWHFTYVESLFENFVWRMRTNPETYSTSNSMHINQLAIWKCRWLLTKFQGLKTRTKFKLMYSVPKERSHSTANIKTTGIAIHLRPSYSERWSSLPLCFDKRLENSDQQFETTSSTIQ